MNQILDMPTLDKITLFAREAQTNALFAKSLTRPGSDSEDMAAAHEHLIEGTAALGKCVQALQGLGAALPNHPPAEPIPLHQLDTPDTRALLEGVRALVPLADRIDRDRGRSLDVAFPGDVRGLDLADLLHSLRLRLENEIYGPKGKD